MIPTAAGIVSRFIPINNLRLCIGNRHRSLLITQLTILKAHLPPGWIDLLAAQNFHPSDLFCLVGFTQGAD